MRLRPGPCRLVLPMLGVISLAACGEPTPAAPASPASQPQAAAAPSAPPILTRDQIEQATIALAASPAPASPSAAAAQAPAAGLLRVQILLDRAAFSPGQIDGLHGENTRQAIAAYREAKNLGTGDAADAALLQSLTATDAGPVTTEYVITPADVAGPFSPPPTPDLAAQAAAGTNYASPLEALAERFHVSEALLQGLNPGVNFAVAGARIVVPVVRSQPLAQVARIEVDKSEKAVKAFDAAGALVAFYPATIGSGDNPTPRGDLKVNGVARNPDYLYDPSRLTFGAGKTKVTVPPGPNNPVGAVWIDLSRDTYGIHGTPDPTTIGKTASHGCVRLTNWDAQRLAAAVRPGVEVKFV